MDALCSSALLFGFSALLVSCCVCCRPTWMGDDYIVAAVVPAGVGPPPVKPPSAIGPKVQDNTAGKKAQARTYQDLLKDAHDEDTFEYYTNTELVAVQVRQQISAPPQHQTWGALPASAHTSMWPAIPWPAITSPQGKLSLCSCAS